MKVIIVDFSIGEFRKVSEKEISTYLIKMSPRIYIGDIPLRSFRSLINRFKKIATKSTDIYFLIATEDGYHGWKGIHVGKENEKYKSFEGFSFVIDE